MPTPLDNDKTVFASRYSTFTGKLVKVITEDSHFRGNNTGLQLPRSVRVLTGDVCINYSTSSLLVSLVLSCLEKTIGPKAEFQ
ncbi:hypothetical protein GLAREA_00757 [Glarea lozoyensis ATCC 20868]|uniref:Uncharacterized protein n=1 Tax=Glarea lozoyensis (strain ATCC 20868 / MF5171) TaxID=1116229 RepID=S3CT42_GLAL2|nr:uncharacterized protein GLAREA_00757 [Glarea lozoyensis ATCC 20868]EPE29597.1 hypothetical protein GLAREA_00757 [Glarea lozoyensis ATCC 20868]